MGRIVLIEDDEMDAKTFVNLCVDRQVTTEKCIVTYPSAEAFLTVARASGLSEADVACIFVDLQLDDEDPSDRSGLEAADLLRAELESVPLIAYTRHWEAWEITNVTMHEFDGVLHKQDFQDKTKFPRKRFVEAINAWRRKRSLGAAEFEEAGPSRLARPVILHLSDPQFGKAYADARQLADDIVAAVEDDLPNLVVISGDLAESGRPEEYALAMEFLERLCVGLSIPDEAHHRIVLCPGNHDVNWRLAAGFLKPSDDETGKADVTGTSGFLYRFAPFFDFYAEFYGEEGASCLPRAKLGYDLFDLRGYGLTIAAINSSWYEHRGCKRGQIPTTVFEGLEADMEKLGSAEKVLRMAVFHHPLQVGVGGGLAGGTEDLIDDPPGVSKRLAALGIQVIFTGHLHSSSVEEIHLETASKKGVQRIFNLLAGSVGVPEDDRPLIGGFGHLPNDFGVLRMSADREGWEYEAFSLDVGSRMFLPKPKFHGRKAVRPVEIGVP